MKNFFARFKKNKKPTASQELPTVPMPKRPLESSNGVPSLVEFNPPQYIAGCAISTGKVRDHNEDALFSFSSVVAMNESSLPIGLYIVADGMGGHNEGEIASEIAVRTASHYLIDNVILKTLSNKASPTGNSMSELLTNSVLAAHDSIVQEAPGSGTTLTIALINNREMHIAHIGDSRAYLIQPDKRMKAITRDHSLVGRMVELGHLSDEEAAHHPQRNVLYRALGQEEPPEAELYRINVPSNGYLLLCSDGLWGVVDDEEILRIVLSENEPEKAAQKLVDSANEAGGPDNITAIVVKFLDNHKDDDGEDLL